MSGVDTTELQTQYTEDNKKEIEMKTPGSGRMVVIGQAQLWTADDDDWCHKCVLDVLDCDKELTHKI